MISTLKLNLSGKHSKSLCNRYIDRQTPPVRVQKKHCNFTFFFAKPGSAKVQYPDYLQKRGKKKQYPETRDRKVTAARRSYEKKKQGDYTSSIYQIIKRKKYVRFAL